MIASKRIRLLEEEVDASLSALYAKIEEQKFHCDTCKANAKAPLDSLKVSKSAMLAALRNEEGHFADVINLLDFYKKSLKIIANVIADASRVGHEDYAELAKQDAEDDDGSLLN